MQTKKHKWVLPLLLFSFIAYNIGIPLFVHFCASKNTTITQVSYKKHKKDICKDTKITKSCCNKKSKSNCKTNSIPQENTNCYSEYFAPSDCCKLTYQIKQNHQKYISESSKTIKKDTSNTMSTFHRYIAGIPVPLCKTNKKNSPLKLSPLEVPLIEYFPLRL